MGCALDGDCAALSFYDRFGERQSQPDALCVRRLTASVEAFKDMVDIFGSNAVAIVGDRDPCSDRGCVPRNMDGAVCVCVLQRIFDDVADGFDCP